MKRVSLVLFALAVATSLQAAATLKSTYSFERDPLTFREGSGTGTITVLRTGDLSATETIGYGWGFVFLTAFSGTGTLTFAPGETSKTFDITIPNDDYFTGGTAGAASLKDPAGHEIAYTHLLSVDDEPVPTLTGSDVSVVEGNSGSTDVTVHFTLSAPLGENENTYLLLSGSATRDEDYVAPLVVPFHTYHETHFDVTISIKGDTQPEPDETILVGLLITVDNLPAGIQGQARITILNDEYLLTSAPMQQVERGKTTSVELSTSVPASATERILLSSDNPLIASVPAFVDVPAGVTDVTVPVTGVAPGIALVTAQLPPSRGGASLISTVSVFTQTSLAFDRPSIELPYGAQTTAGVHMSSSPAAPLTVQIGNTNAKVVDVPPTVTIDTDGNGSFPIRAVGAGSSYLSVSLPPEYGSVVNGFSVNVLQPSGLAITRLAPASGPAVGNQAVTLFGNEMKGRCVVTFGGVSALSTSAGQGGSVATYTPPHAPGTVDVGIRCGSEDFTFAAAYTYMAAAPVLRSIAPAVGSTKGGTIVTVSGDNLPRGRCRLWLGDAPAATLTNLLPTEMTAVAPPHAAGSAAVRLECGASSSTLSDAFVYAGDDAPAQVAAILPPSGAPGDRVQVAGARFRVSDAIAFGPAAAVDMSTAPGEHVVTVPELGAGPVAVTLRDAEGRSVAGPSFTVLAAVAPRITAAPAKATAGAEIVVNGAGFRPSSRFAVAGVPLPVVDITSSYAILRLPETLAPQTTALAVVDALGTPLASRAIEVTSSGVAVESATPQCVSTEGGALVTITGRGFQPGAVVTFGIADATEVTVRDAQTIVARAPASSGVPEATITVTNPSLESGQLTGFQYRWPESQCGTPRHRAAGR